MTYITTVWNEPVAMVALGWSDGVVDRARTMGGIRGPRALRAVSSSDDILLARIADGDQDALAELYDRYQSLAFGLATRLTGDRAAAQDVVQETFLGVWRNAGRFDSARASARTWMMAICHHRAVDALRRRRPTSQLPDADVPPPQALIAPDIWPEVARRFEASGVRQALDLLPAAQREVIELAYFVGLTQHEIAARTDAPLGTVKSRARLALEGLRRSLDNHDRDHAMDGAGSSMATEDLQ